MTARQQAEVAGIPKKDKKERKRAAKRHREEEEALRKRHWAELEGLNEDGADAGQAGGDPEEEEGEDDDEGKRAEEAAARAAAEAEAEERRRGEEKRAKAARKKAEKDERQKTKEAERRAEAERGADAMADLRKMENEALERALAGLSLKVREVQADGHRLYRAFDDQLDSSGGGGGNDGARGVDQLRADGAAYMRAHRDDFLPYLDEDGTGALDDAAFERYCDAITAKAPVA